MSTMTTTPPRRSNRARNQTNSYYDDEKKRIEEEDLHKANEEDEEEQEVTDDEAEEEEEEEEEMTEEEPMQIDEEEDDDDDEDYNNKSTKKSKTTPKKTSKNRSPKRVNSSSKSPIQKVLSSRATSTKNNTAIFKLLFSPSRRVGVGAGTNGGDGKMKNNNKQNKSVQNALQLLHTKIMNLNTTTTKQGKKRLGESLFMSILETSCSKKQKQPLLKKKSFVASTTTTCPSDEMHYSQPTSTYTEDLRQIACELIHEYNKTNNPHVMHIQLLNLLFLSIGGTSKTMLVSENEDGMDGDEEDEDDDVANDEQDIKKNEDNIKNGQIVDNLEDLDVTDWSEIVTNVVLDTRNTPLECIPFCADPHGALHWNAMQTLQQQQQQTDGRGEEKQLHAVSERDVVVKKANINMILAVKTYRSIFEEFWYILGTVALVEGGMSNKQDDISDNDDDNEDTDDEEEEISPSSKKRQRKRTKEKSKTKRARKTPSTSATTRFDTEIVTNILSRINEIIAMGQPDIRAVATSAAQFLLRAVVDKTSLVQERLITAKRQHAAATKKGNGSGAKVKSLQHQIDSLERTLNDLESVVENFFIRVIFMYRYRDSNMYIRASCIETLGHFLLIKPDFFLKDKFLKYFGWMMSDKAECVRIAALSSLLAPFQIIDSESIKDQKIAKNINLSEMDRVIGKFLPRIADCVFDVQESVQEVAVKMMLTLLRHEFLEEVEDEEGNVENPLPDKTWEQINLMALAPDTSPIVRRDALYFIMEQLEDFDEGKEDEDDIEEMSDSDSLYSKQKSVKRRNSLSTNISDRKLAQRLDAIASWASHALSSGKIPIQKVRIHLVDYLVHSLRAMPQHKSIVTSWSAMLRAIKDDNIAMTSQGTAAGDKANVAKQRVLVQMLICAAKAEVESVDPDYLHTNVDSDVVDLLKKKLIEETKEENCPPTKRARASSNLQHENLSIALMKALPDLLVQFKSDSAIIESLVSLPRYFITSVLSLPQRKKDFVGMMKNLIDVFLQSNDDNILRNCALSLACLCKGDHARVVEAKTAVKQCVIELRDRILLHISVSKGSKNSDALDIDTENEDLEDDFVTNTDKHFALYHNLKRFGALSLHLNISDFIGSSENSEDSIEAFCNFVADSLAYRLRYFEPKGNKNKGANARLLQITARLVYEGLQFLLSITAWMVKSMQEENGLIQDRLEIMDSDENAEDDGEDDHVAIRLRDRLVVLVELCFEQHLPESRDAHDFSFEQQEWSETVQEIGGVISSDLRSLFLQEWANAASPLLRAAAITDDSRLIAGYKRVFCEKELDIKEDPANAKSILLPLVRSIASNWKLGNRREASYALCHITGSSATASNIIESFSRLLKKVDPMRLLEAQMASLCRSYEKWLNNDPEEVMGETLTQGTDDMTMNAFQELEKQHQQQFKNLQSQAQKYSSSLGVRKLSDEHLSEGLLAFMREGIRYSFSGDDELLLGCRLSFLTILMKYSHWIKKNRSHLREIIQYLYGQESELKAQELKEREASGDDFEGIHEDDLKALANFRSSLGMKESTIFSPVVKDTPLSQTSSRFDSSQFSSEDILEEDRDLVSDMSPLTVPSTAPRGRKSRGSAGSALSKMSSTRSSLSPLYEAEGVEDDESPEGGSEVETPITNAMNSPNSARSLSQFSTSESRDLLSPSSNTLSPAMSKTQSTFDGEQSEIDSGEE